MKQIVLHWIKTKPPTQLPPAVLVQRQCQVHTWKWCEPTTGSCTWAGFLQRVSKALGPPTLSTVTIKVVFVKLLDNIISFTALLTWWFCWPLVCKTWMLDLFVWSLLWIWHLGEGGSKVLESAVIQWCLCHCTCLHGLHFSAWDWLLFNQNHKLMFN